MIAAASSAGAAANAAAPCSNEIARQIPFVTNLEIRRAESMAPGHYCPGPGISQRRELFGYRKRNASGHQQLFVQHLISRAETAGDDLVEHVLVLPHDHHGDLRGLVLGIAVDTGTDAWKRDGPDTVFMREFQRV